MTRVLFVDNDVLSLQLMSKVSQMLGFQAILSPSAANGLQLAAQEKPAIIFVDLQMEEMDGVEFVRQLRLSPEIGHLPVLIYTAGLGYFDEERAREAGANGFIQKPLGINQLLETIQRYAPSTAS